MNDSSFTTSILVDQTASDAFNAINNVRGWWPGEFEGTSNQLNDEFTYRYKQFHYSKQKVVEFIPDQKIVWLVTESSLNFVQKKNEWTGTRIVFEISQSGNKTRIQFTHLGLIPGYECFKDCSSSWTEIIGTGLRGLIATRNESAGKVKMS